MATTSTPGLNRTTSAAPLGAEGDHNLDQAEEAVEHRADQSSLAASLGYGESNETDGIQASNNDMQLVPDALKAERRRSIQLENEIRSLKQQLNRFSEINPEEYTRLQEAEKQKQKLEQQLELRKRQMEEASARKVAAIAAERDAAAERVL